MSASSEVYHETVIDQTQFVPLKWMNERFEFLKKKGIAAYNGKKILLTPRAKWPIDRLFEDENILDSCQREAGIRYMTLCDVVSGRASAQGAKDGEPDKILPVVRKVIIEQQLTVWGKYHIKKIIVWSQSTPFVEEDYRQMHRIAAKIQEAFNELIEAMREDNIQKLLDERHNGN
jgi:hypothetical protein